VQPSPIPSAAPTIPPLAEDFARQWIDAKAWEDTAKASRLAIEAAICANFKFPPGATETVYVMPGFKVVWGISRTLDTDALRAAWDTLSEVAQGCVRWKAEVAATQYHAAADLVPAAVAALNKFITTKDSKPAFTFTPPKPKA